MLSYKLSVLLSFFTERHLNLNVSQGQISFASWDPLCFF